MPSAGMWMTSRPGGGDFLALAGADKQAIFPPYLVLTRREQFLVAFVVLAFLLGFAVKQWRSSQNLAGISALPAATQ